MERGEVQSKLRNPILAGLLRDIPGYMERIGSGIRFMLDETKHLGLPQPQFRETGEVIVTFYKALDLMPPQTQPQKQVTLWEEDKERSTHTRLSLSAKLQLCREPLTPASHASRHKRKCLSMRLTHFRPVSKGIRITGTTVDVTGDTLNNA